MKKFTKIASIILAMGLFFNSFTEVAQGTQFQMWNTSAAISGAKEIKTGTNISGFKLESKKWIQDIQSTA
ncbi:MAG: hypothetical protein MUO60_04640, partial [Clostridiaceae bacterium]|nr:hypothetical protein [Clostridiaceae bacterium]